MNGDEKAENVTGDGHVMPERAQELSSPDFAVVISRDGSVAIDGVPVPVSEGEAVDSAVLDTLHGYAQIRAAGVTASIADETDAMPGHQALIEVFPDGSSTILQHPGESSEESTAKLPPTPGDDGLSNYSPDTGDFGGPHTSPFLDADERADHQHPAKYELPKPVESPLVSTGQRRESSSHSARSGSKSGRGNAPRQSDDEYEGPGLLSRPIVIGPMALAVATLVVVPLAILGSGGGTNGNGRQAQAVDSGNKPSASATDKPGLPSPSSTPSTSPGTPFPSLSAKPSQTPGSEQTQSTAPAKPGEVTAATALDRLSGDDPSGRHICYRAYVGDQGWQKPVCDGRVAGAAGDSQPIKALNIAVSGTNGSAGNAFTHRTKSPDGKGEWKSGDWTCVTPDDEDCYIGTAGPDAPDMLGFVISVGSGRICQMALLHGAKDWMKGCAEAKARVKYTFGGTVANDSWLESVTFTV